MKGWRKELAKTVKAHVIRIPVVAVNTIKFPATAEKLLEEGVSDFVGVSRGQMADPEWVNKTRAGREDLIRKVHGLYAVQQVRGAWMATFPARQILSQDAAPCTTMNI